MIIPLDTISLLIFGLGAANADETPVHSEPVAILVVARAAEFSALETEAAVTRPLEPRRNKSGSVMK